MNRLHAAIRHSRNFCRVGVQGRDNFWVVRRLDNDDAVVGDRDLRLYAVAACEKDIQCRTLNNDPRVIPPLDTANHPNHMADEPRHYGLIRRPGDGSDTIWQIRDLTRDRFKVAEHDGELGAFLGRCVQAPQARHVHFVVPGAVGTVHVHAARTVAHHLCHRSARRKSIKPASHHHSRNQTHRHLEPKSVFEIKHRDLCPLLVVR